MAKKEYLTEMQDRCFECYRSYKNGSIMFEDCRSYQELKPFLNGDPCLTFVSILSDISKAHRGVKRIEGITNPAILRAIAEDKLEDIPREAYE